jgi:hypothetical protein
LNTGTLENRLIKAIVVASLFSVGCGSSTENAVITKDLAMSNQGNSDLASSDDQGVGDDQGIGQDLSGLPDLAGSDLSGSDLSLAGTDLSNTAAADLSNTTVPDMATVTGCGTCPTGYTCGSANGIAVCRAASGIPLFSHVFIIVMENTSWSTLQGDSPTNTPFVHGLISSAAYSTNYHGVAHPSLPNYIAMTSGSTGKQADGSPVTCDCNPTGSDCMACNILSSCNCEQNAQHIGDQIEAAGKSWKAYAESMGSACNLKGTTDYVPRHVPFLYYQNVQSNASRCSSHVIDYKMFAGDLGGTVPSFAFIAPNLTDDMHGTMLFMSQTTNMHNGDKWLSTNVPAITGSNAFKQGGLLIIVWDEDDGSGGLTQTDDPIGMFVLSPLAKSSGFNSATKVDHYALLATIEDGLALAAPKLGAAANATPLVDFFPAQ